MILESIWQVDIINGHFHDIFYQRSEPKLLLRNNKFNIVLYDSENTKTFSNITMGMINGSAGYPVISRNELSQLLEVELPDTKGATHPDFAVKYLYSESIDQTIIDVDDEVAIIASTHYQSAFWNGKTKRVVPHAQHVKVYWLEYINDKQLSLSEVQALKEQVENEKADHTSMISKMVLSNMKIYDIRKSPICKKLIEEVTL